MPMEIELDEENQVYTVAEFCKVHRISRSTFERYLKKGDGPKIMKFPGRILISKEAAAEWRINMGNLSKKDI